MNQMYLPNKTKIIMTLCVIIISALLPLSGCSKVNGGAAVTFSEKEKQSGIEVTDPLTCEWTGPSSEPVEVDGWEVVQYVPGLAVPSNEEYTLWMNLNAFGRNRLYSALFLEAYNGTEQYTAYEMKAMDLETMEIKTVWQSLSDLDFRSVWSDDYISLVDEKLLSGDATVVSIDCFEDRMTMFLSVDAEGGTLEHLYSIETDEEGRVCDVTDYADYYPSGSITVVPEIICGKDGAVYILDYEKREIRLLDASGAAIFTLDAKEYFKNLKCIGKNPDGIPIFSCTPAFEKVEFYYIDAKGLHVLFSGKLDSGEYALDKHGNLLILNGNRLLLWNISTGELSTLYDFVRLDGYVCMGISPNENGEIIACFQYGDDAFIYRLNDYDHPDIQELVLLQDFKDPYTEKCAADYSRTHPTVRINVEQLDTNDDFSWNKMLSKIKSGSGPDIIYTGRKRLDNLRKAGVISPLTGLISDAVLDNVFEGAMKIGEFETDLYAVPCEAGLRVMLIADDCWNKTSWTIQEAMETYIHWKEVTGGKRMFSAVSDLDPLNLFKDLCIGNIESSGFVDLNSNTCCFDSSAFRELLEFCRNYSDVRETATINLKSTDDRVKEVIKGEAFVYFLAAGLIGYSDARKQLDEGYHTLGSPSENGVESIVECSHAAAVSAASDNKEAAADFVASLVSDEYQTKYTTYWVRKDVLADHIKNADKGHIHADSEIESNTGPSFEKNRMMRIPLAGRADGTSYADEYIALMDAGVPLSVEYEIQEILIEEVSAYFADAKTEDEVAKIIQDRVQLYLDERNTIN